MEPERRGRRLRSGDREHFSFGICNVAPSFRVGTSRYGDIGVLQFPERAGVCQGVHGVEGDVLGSSPHYYLLFDVLTVLFIGVLIGSSLLTFSQFSATYSTLPPLRRPRGSPRQHPQASHCRPHGFLHRRPHGSLHGRSRRFSLADVLTAPHCLPQYFLLIDVLTVFLDFLSAFSI